MFDNAWICREQATGDGVDDAKESRQEWAVLRHGVVGVESENKIKISSSCSSSTSPSTSTSARTSTRSKDVHSKSPPLVVAVAAQKGYSSDG